MAPFLVALEPVAVSEDSCSDDMRSGILATTVLSFSASPTRVHVDEEVTFTVSASSSVPGATLYFTIFFDSRLPGMINNPASPSYSTSETGSPATINVTYAYDHIGNLTSSQGTYFIATVWVSDGTDTKTSQLIVYVVANTAPIFMRSLPPSIPYSVENVEFDGRILTLDYSDLFIRVQDLDNDPLEVLWDFGDGNTSTNSTLPALSGVYVNQSHVWFLEMPPGEPRDEGYVFEYTVTVSVSDGNDHTITDVMTLELALPLNDGPTAYLSAPSVAPPGEAVTIRANATDPEGDDLFWTFLFGDGDSAVYATDGVGWLARDNVSWMNVTHSYESVGEYAIRVYVSDALVNQTFPHNVTRSSTINIRQNTLPIVTTIIAFPDTPEVNLTTGVIDVRFSVQVQDADGNPLTVLWDFGDGTETSNSTLGGTSTYKIRQNHSYTNAGSFNVTVTVNDGFGPDVVVWRLLNVTSKNRPPSLIELSFEYEGELLLPNQTFQMIVVLSEPETDTIQVYVDFGDGSPRVYLNLTQFVGTNTTFTLEHSYSKVGTYTVTLWYTDNKIGVFEHTKTSTRTLTVQEPDTSAEVIWDWWDYTSLALFCMIPVLAVGWAVVSMRRQKQLEKKGITYEEWQLRKDELAEQLKKTGRE